MAPALPFHLYLVTDRTRTAGRPLLDVVEQALEGGVDAVQLREKDLTGRELFATAQSLRTLCSRYNAHLLINDRIDVAVAVGANGVHLPVDSFDAADARRLLGSPALVGCSTHNLAEARAAAAAGANFIVFGPVFETPSKRSYGPPLGLEALLEAACSVPVPVLAIGGITVEHVASVRRCGASGVAVVSSILAASDPTTAAASIRSRLTAVPVG